MAFKNKKSIFFPKISQTLVKGSKRFVLSEIRKEVETKHIQELEIKQLKMQKAKEDLEKYESKLRYERATYMIIASEYGLGILESALRGETSYLLEDVTAPKLDIKLVFIDRGFDVYEQEFDYSVEELDEKMRERYFHYHPSVKDKIIMHISNEDSRKKFRIILINELSQIKRLVKFHPELNVDSSKHFRYLQEINSLFLAARFFQDNSLDDLVELASSVSKIQYYHEAGAIKEIVEMVNKMSKNIINFEPDDLQFSRFEVDWERFNISCNVINDCLEAPFLNWLSSDFGKVFTKDIFTKIEEANLIGKKSLTFEAKLTKIQENFWAEDEISSEDDVLVPALQIFKSIIPFDVSYLVTMFSILGYTCEPVASLNEEITINISWE